MPEMFCPRCGRELELDSGEIRFCRYCGFALADTKDALHGYSERKRVGFSIVTCSYALVTDHHAAIAWQVRFARHGFGRLVVDYPDCG
jgi:hypothetical protein